MINSGDYNRFVEIYQDLPSDTETDELDNPKMIPTKQGETFAKIESRVGSLLAGRAADTVVSKTTMKISWPYYNFPEVIADKHYIMFEGHRFNIDYSLDDGFKHEELQVFCNELS